FSILDHCATPMGSRLLRRWLLHPLRNNKAALQRQQSITTLLSPAPADGLDIEEPLDTLRSILNRVPDLERIATPISLRSVRPRQLASLRDCLQQMPAFAQFITERYPQGQVLEAVRNDLELDPDIAALLDRAIADEPAQLIRDGGVLATGFDEELDELLVSVATRELSEQLRGF